MSERSADRARLRRPARREGVRSPRRSLFYVVATAAVVAVALLALAGIKTAKETTPKASKPGAIGSITTGPVSLPRWQTALAAGNARLAVYGDSISEDTPSRALAWPSQLRRMMGSKISTAAGSGLILLTLNSVTEESRVTYTGKWANSPHGIDGAAREASGPGNTLVFRPGITGDQFLIDYRTGAQWGTFSYQIDGGPAVAVAATSTTNSVATVSIPVSTSTTHTLTINSPADATVVDISAVELVSGRGLRLANLAKSGAGTAMFNPPQGIASCFTPIRPNLSVIFLEANDYDTQLPLATYTANLQAAIDNAKLTGDVLLVVTVPENYQGAHPIPRSSYTAALYTLAAANHVGLLDLTKRWVSFAHAKALGLYVDNLTHPSARGAADIARAVYATIVPGSRPAPPPR